MQRRNAALYHLIDQFKRGLQASEDRAQASEDRAQASEDRAQALRDSLREIVSFIFYFEFYETVVMRMVGMMSRLVGLRRVKKRVG